MVGVARDDSTQRQGPQNRDPIAVAWGARVKQLRERAGLKQAQLAERVGCRQGTISDLETGRAKPSLALAFQVARTLNVSVDELWGEPTTDELVGAA